MSIYLLIKWMHILSSTVLFGTGIGIAFFKWMTDRSEDVRAIRIVNERTVLADLVLTTPAVILQPLTGFALVYVGGYTVLSGWLMMATLLYLLAGCCWLPVLWLQLRMRDIARIADGENSPLPALYWRYARIWFWLGIPAFISLMIVYWLMVFKPVL
jgi:uncharacterized membrane protein